jgi:hypothetical protein
VQQAFRALPQLWPGKNAITLRGKLAKGAAVRVTYLWDDAAGKGRRNVTVAESLPHRYTILAAGKKWEDVVCRELLVETIAASGKGSRTLVREAPAEADAPDQPTVPDTRTRWQRKLARGKPPTVEQVVAWLGQPRTVRNGLVWASELADARTFDAVAAVAFDTELCKAKTVKELALVALYNIDPDKARPLLLKIANDRECKSGWKFDAKNPAVAEGHWMSGVCIIGQQAADAGWTEFVEPLARAMESKRCGDRHRMSLLRSLSELAGPGDSVAVAAIRESLAMSFPYMLTEAARAAGVVGDRESIPRLRELLDHSFLVVRRSAAVALGRLGDTASAPKLRKSLFTIRKRGLLDHHKYGTEIYYDENLRAAAAEGLGLMKDKASLPDLRRALANEPVPWVRDTIAAAIKAIEGAD